MYHRLLALGYLGKEVEMRYLPNGDPVANFSLATQDGFGERKKTVWFNVSVFGKLAETCNKYLKKGSMCLVEGRMNADDSGNPRTWNRQDGSTGASYEVTAQTVRFLSSKNDMPVDEEEIPF